jgi:hypothetical protein
MPILRAMQLMFPDKYSNYTLLEDDGVSFDYEKGSIAKATFALKRAVRY